ncbi:MAG: L,D-transpeptidase family protein [Pseudomonadota bacterium]
MVKKIRMLGAGQVSRVAGIIALMSVTGSAVAEVYPLPGPDEHVIGSVTTIRSIAADTLVDIARRHGLGYTDMLRANPGVDPWLPGEGTKITLPTQFVLPDAPREGVVLNLAEYRLYYYPPAKAGEPPVVHTYPISIGRMDWETPLGLTSVVAKAVRPAWYPPASIRKEHAEAGDPLPSVVPPGPDNPLGNHAIRLGLPGYLIHGTNRPAGVGMRVTHGCIRMFPEDIEVLFGKLPLKTAVRIVNQPVKFGWLNGELFMESHEPLASAAPPPLERPDSAALAIAETGNNAAGSATAVTVEPMPPSDEEVDAPSPLTLITRAYVGATRDRRASADWALMESLFADALGIPQPVGTELPAPAEIGAD